MASPRTRRRTVTEQPGGLRYAPDLLTAAEEAGLLREVEGLEFGDVRMRGQTAKRTVRHFGWDYEYESWQLVPGDPFPAWLEQVRDRCAAWAELASADSFVQALVTRYPAGAGIGWHRDAPMFGEPVVGVSLRAPCRMRFQRRAGDERRSFELQLEPRSVYALSRSARWAWQHSIPATPDLRYSITFRTLRKGS